MQPGLPQTIVFNRFTSGQAADYFADDPELVLTRVEGSSQPRLDPPPEPWRAALEDRLAGAVLDPTLGWAYHGYRVEARPAAAAPERHDDPPGPLRRQERFAEAGPPAYRATAAEGRPASLILFNVLVGLEWLPDADYLRQLRWAFRRASDFLYDVTDGGMAFGQVLFVAEPELLPYADIQVMASNRLHPRSWVNGLREPAKRAPIRLGRGLWHGRGRIAIPWDEPEGYRTIIHEWAHYALGLHDAYLARPTVAPAPVAGLAALPADVLVEVEAGRAGGQRLVVPEFNPVSESIMAHQVGTSELSARRMPGVDDEWREIEQYFPTLRRRAPVDGQPDEGPGRLPFPLPQFFDLTAPAAKAPRTANPIFLPASRAASGPPFTLLPPDAAPERCRLYVVRGLASDAPLVVAQGTLDRRSAYKRFPLLGAQAGDAVVLVATGPAAVTVVRGEVTAGGVLADWRATSLSAIPRVALVPARSGTEDQRVGMTVRLETNGAPPRRAILCPLGEPAGRLDRPAEPITADWTSLTTPPLALDGHLLLDWGSALLILPYSQGGGPASSNPHAPHAGAPPITAGSSDGNVMLFFHDERAVGQPDSGKKVEPYATIRVATAALPAAAAVGRAPAGGRLLGDAYSIAGNQPLPLELEPTLVLAYEGLSEREALTGDLVVCRLVDGAWRPLPTYAPPGRGQAATPLAHRESGGRLTDPQAEHVEYYAVAWRPRP